jgi:FkbM family methyltransferase
VASGPVLPDGVETGAYKLIVRVNFSAIPAGSWIGFLLRLPLRVVPSRAVVPVLQGPLRGKKWVAGSSDHGCWLGSYELPKQRLFAAHLHPGDVVFDIGAHVGFYSLLAAEHVGRKGKVVAFEPLPANVQHLRRHVELNGYGNIGIIEAAVSDVEGQAVFAAGASTTQGSLSNSGTLEVRTVTIDSLARSGRIPLPNLMKLDVEGAEAAALRGATHVLRSAAPLIFLATHGSAVRDECHGLLRDLDYDIAPISDSPGNETEFLCRPRQRP